jgi:hypothetical protein
VVGTKDGKPYPSEEIFIGVVVPPNPGFFPGMAPGANPGGIGIKDVRINVSTSVVTIELEGTVDSGFGGNTVIADKYDAGSNFDPAKLALGDFSYLTLKGLYSIIAPTDFPIKIRIYSQGLNINYAIGTNAYVSSGAFNSPGVWRQMAYPNLAIATANDFDDELTFLLWNGGTGTTAKIITMEVTQNNSTATYIIDWSGVEITP